MAQFVKHAECPKCGSKDNLAVYDDGSSYCFSDCGYKTLSEEFKELLQDSKPKKKRKDTMADEKVLSTKPIITPEDAAEIKSNTAIKANGFRSIKDETYAYFGVRHSFDETTGEVEEQYYPCTQEGQLTGYKIREVPKNFRSIGRTGADCELFGQFRFNRGGKYVVITEGEADCLAAYEMLKEYNKSKGWDFETAVVSPTTGAQSRKQIANQYKFFDQFEQIIISYDNDDAGKKASEEIVKYLPKGKVKIMQLRYKDANDYLTQGKSKEFISDFYNAKAFVPVGVIGSGEITKSMRDEFTVPKIPLPPFMHKLQDMMAGGVPLGRIVNLGSASGQGKSTIIDEIVYYMLFHSPHKVGVVTLESTTGQYGIKLLSRHINLKLELKTNQEALEILESEQTKKKEKELFWTETGEHRFFLVDDRDGGVDNVKDAIENLIIGCGCKVIVLDPVNDAIGSLSNEEQETFYSWQKGMVKSHQVTFYNVMHTRKTSGGQKAGSAGADLHEEDLMGSSSAYKSAACNLMFNRNKEAEDDIERNTTVMKATKIRWTGKTGIAGKYYYDNEKHTLYDLDDWLKENSPGEF